MDAFLSIQPLYTIILGWSFWIFFLSSFSNVLGSSGGGAGGGGGVCGCGGVYYLSGVVYSGYAMFRGTYIYRSLAGSFLYTLMRYVYTHSLTHTAAWLSSEICPATSDESCHVAPIVSLLASGDGTDNR